MVSLVGPKRENMTNITLTTGAFPTFKKKTVLITLLLLLNKTNSAL